MPRIFMDSLDKSAFYIYVFSRTNILSRLDAVYSTYILKIHCINLNYFGLLRAQFSGDYRKMKYVKAIKTLRVKNSKMTISFFNIPATQNECKKFLKQVRTSS